MKSTVDFCGSCEIVEEVLEACVIVLSGCVRLSVGERGGGMVLIMPG